MTLCLSLVTVYNDIQTANDGLPVLKSTQAFSDLKVSNSKNKTKLPIQDMNQYPYIFFKQELAKRFALSFGLDAIKNREAIISLHRAGILFAVQQNVDTTADPSAPPPRLLFLDILNEFTNKLLKQDKKVVYVSSKMNGFVSCAVL